MYLLVHLVIFVIVAAVLWFLLNWAMSALEVPAKAAQFARVLFVIVLVLVALGYLLGWRGVPGPLVFIVPFPPIGPRVVLLGAA